MQQTKYMRIVAAGLLMTLFAACAKDDTIVPYDTTEGIPCTVTLNVGAAPAPEITVTRADNSLSTLSSLKIFVYDKDGQVCQNVATLSSTDITENGTYSNGETLYKVSIETTSGEKQLFAIANYGSGYWDQSGIDVLCSQAEEGALTLAELRDGVVSLSNDDFNINTDGNLNLPSITASNQMLISGWNTGVVFAAGNGSVGAVTKYGTRGDSNDSVAIKMQRSMAHISFNIASDSDTKTDDNGVKHTCRFTPSTFRVYNIPMKILIGQTDENRTMADANKVQEYLISASTNVGTNQSGDYAFDFYMPENVQEEGTSNVYADRDAWNYGGDQASTTGDGALPEEKTWTNAPQNSTFVVIKGTYEETTGENEDPYYTANVNYTVHLGDFSGDTPNYGNFSVVRNYKYTYNMKVQGVDKIVVEAKKTGGETQSGAEGDVYDASQCVYNYQLDAHYEQVFLQYNLSSMARSLASGLSGAALDNAIADKLILVIQSEAMDYTGGIGNVANKRGSIKPYKIYADAVRGKSGQEAETAAANAKSDALDDDPTNNEQRPKKGFDYKWVEFWPQSGTQLAAYPGVSWWSREDLDGFSNKDAYGGEPTDESGDLKDVYDVIVAMGNVVKKIYNNVESVSTADRGEDGITITKSNNDYVARFTAFVNEYYYYRHPLTGLKVTTWSVMTNKIPREMIIAMSTDVSNDGNSSYSQLHSYISQLSMQTFYSSRSMSLNAFGIESYNETPISYSFDGNTLPESLNDPRESDALTQTDGRYNQIRLLQRTPSQNGTYGSWETYINSGQNGYFSTTTADRASHKLNNAYNRKYAYSACLSRNRDLNGNGTIDDNEVRWYLASVNEYIRMGIGTNALSNLARLYMGAKGEMVKSLYPASYTTDGALYYTSSRDTYNGWGYSSSGQRLYWAVERGAYGGDQYSNIPMRCIRILPAHTDDQDITSVYNVKSDPTYEWDATNRILKFKGRLVDELYRQYVSGVLMPHNEDSNANSFYDGIYVAEEDVYETQSGWKVTKKFPLAQIINYDGNQENPCADYHETGDGGAVWRVPNLAELSALVAQGLINQDVEDACCTQFSNMDVRFGFAFSSLVYCPGGGDIEQYDGTFAVRCVRDVPPGSNLLE